MSSFRKSIIRLVENSKWASVKSNMAHSSVFTTVLAASDSYSIHVLNQVPLQNIIAGSIRLNLQLTLCVGRIQRVYDVCNKRIKIIKTYSKRPSDKFFFVFENFFFLLSNSLTFFLSCVVKFSRPSIFEEDDVSAPPRSIMLHVDVCRQRSDPHSNVSS